MRKVELLPTRDCEAGYGTGHRDHFLYSLGISIYHDGRRGLGATES